MIYGRYGEMENPNYLDTYMNQDGTGLKFKIDDIIIHMESYRNYYLNDKELAEFEFVRELTDEEFYPMELLIHSHYKYPHNFENHWAPQQYLPDELKNTKYYYPQKNKNEQAFKAYWDKIEGKSN